MVILVVPTFVILSVVSYRIDVEDAGSAYVHLFITYFNTITNQIFFD